MDKVEKHLKLCNVDYVDNLCFWCIVQNTWQIELTDDLCEVHEIHTRIFVGMNFKRCEDGS